MRKALGAALCAALVLLSPGAGCYQALAADAATRAPKAGLPAAAPAIAAVPALSLPRLDEAAPHPGLSGSAGALSGAAESLPAADYPQIAGADDLWAAPAPTPAATTAGGSRLASVVSLVRGTIADWTSPRPDADAPAAAARTSRTRRALARATPHLRRAARALPPAVGVAAGAAAVAAPAVALPMLAVAAGAAASILLHEAAHLWALRRYGDDTAALQGVRGAWDLLDWRFTVSLPLATGLASTLLMQLIPGAPLLLAGWAKPLPVDFNKLRDVKRQAGLVAAAGPAMNAALMAGFAAAAWLLPLPAAAAGALLLLAKINAGLAAFNMMPLPHLDGGKVLISLLPQRLYERWIRNSKIPDDYQRLFTRLYEGPSTLLNLLSISGQREIGVAAAGVSVALLVAMTVSGWWFLGAPVVLLMLGCAYDYACIREKIQNENAVRDIQNLILSVASGLKAEAKKLGLQTKVNTEKVEHALKNAFENTVDKVVDSEGFERLDAEQRWQRLEAAYVEAAVEGLKREGFASEDESAIRLLMRSEAALSYLRGLRSWVERYDVWKKWHSPGRKAARARDEEQAQEGAGRKGGTAAGGALATLALGVLGAGVLGALGVSGAPGAMIAGTLRQQPQPPKAPTFAEALDDPKAKLPDPEKKKLVESLVSDMKKRPQEPLTARLEQAAAMAAAVSQPRGIASGALVVGESGVGKTALVRALAQDMALSDSQDARGTFKLKAMDRRFLLELNVPALLRQQDPGQAFELLAATLRALDDPDPRTGHKAVLFVDNFQRLFETPKALPVAEAIVELMGDGRLAVVAATTPEGRRAIEKHAGAARRFATVRLAAPDAPETLDMLRERQPAYESSFGVRVEAGANDAAAELSRFDQTRPLPARAFMYLERAAGAAGFDRQHDALARAIKRKIKQLQHAADALARELGSGAAGEEEPGAIRLYNRAVALTQELVGLSAAQAALPETGTPAVTAELVKREIAVETGIPSGQLGLGATLAKKYLELKDNVSRRVIGQDEAIEAIAASLIENQAGLSDPNAPLGVFYANGPTGSGKTHLARELARYLFDDPEAMVRIDMTEYMEQHASARLIGAPPGYVGYEQGGQLTEPVRSKPYSIVLFDEIEKAHPKVWMLLLQIMGEGRLTDSQGRLVDFRNTLILMSSNLGMGAVNVKQYAAEFAALQARQRAAEEAEDQPEVERVEKLKYELAERVAAETKVAAQKATDEAFEVYPPEFKGRLTTPAIVFNRITPQMAPKIVELQLEDLKKLLAFAGHDLDWTPQVKKLIADEGFDIELGARPLKAALRRLITQPLARRLLQSTVANGGAAKPSAIKLAVKRGKIVISAEERRQPPVGREQPGSDAARDVFAKVLDAAVKAAGGQARSALELDAVDSWTKGALAAHGPAPVPPQPKDSVASNTISSSASAQAPAPPAAPRPSLYHPGSPAPVMAAPRKFPLSHADPQRRDERAEAAARAMGEELAAQEVPEAARQALLRELEDPADPYVGWLDVFVEHAKRRAPAGTWLTMDYESASSIKLALRRSGVMDEQERALLERHFGGAAPATPTAARDAAERLENEGLDGSRLMLDLHRKLAQIPGARLGWAQAEKGVEYWIELPKPRTTAEQERALRTVRIDVAKGPLGVHYTVTTMIKGMFAREGLEYVAHAVDGDVIRAEGLAATAQEAGFAAHAYGADRQVLRVDVDARTRPLVRARSDAAPAAAAASAGPVSSKTASGLKELAFAIIEQGSRRSPNVRITAADLAAALSTPGDLAWARERLARLTIMPQAGPRAAADGDREFLHVAFPELAAAAMIVASHGALAADEAALRRALGFLLLQGYYGNDLYRPARRRVIRSLADLLVADPRVTAEALLGRIAAEEAKKARGDKVLAESEFEAYSNDSIVEAYRLALARKAGPEQREAVTRGWDGDRIQATFDYLKRVDPGYLRELFARWRGAPTKVDLAPTSLGMLAAAEYGDRSDVARLFADLTATGRHLERGSDLDAARALGELVARTGSYDLVLEPVRRALRSRLHNELDFHALLVAINVAGAAGGEEQLEALYRLLAIDPERVNHAHEITQHEAAMAWARVAHRLGLVEPLLTQPRPAPSGEAAPPLLQAMLADTNPLMNKAALEALRLQALDPRAAAASPTTGGAPAAGPLDLQWLLRLGPPALGDLELFLGTYRRLDDASVESSRYDLHRLKPETRALAEEWARLFAPLLQRLLGVPFEPEARAYKKGSERVVIWALRQAGGAALAADDVARAADALASLIVDAAKPAAERSGGDAALAEHIGRLQRAGLKMGLHADQDDSERAELWLRIDPPPPPRQSSEEEKAEERARARRHAHGIYDPGEVDPLTGRPWGLSSAF